MSITIELIFTPSETETRQINRHRHVEPESRRENNCYLTGIASTEQPIFMLIRKVHII